MKGFITVALKDGKGYNGKKVKAKGDAMKTVIIYASVHHGNTKKLVDAVSEKYGADTVNALETKEFDLSPYELVGLASGIYAGRPHKALAEFTKKNLPENKKVFFLATSAMNKDMSKAMETLTEGKNAQILGTYACRGYNTFGPFKLVGGTSKGHPDEEDVRKALEFFEGLG